MLWMQGLHIALQPSNLLALVMGTGIGLFMGVLPGLGGVFALTLFIPLTFGLPAAPALIFLVAVHTAAVYGGSIIAILINTPGTPGNIATTFDGYPMAKQGRAGEAIVAAGVAGTVGGLMSVLIVVLVAPLVANVALQINPADYFMLALFGLAMVSAASGGKTIPGLILGGLGFLLSMVGQDPITGAYRFTWGSSYLQDHGIAFSVMVVGLFAMGRAFIMIEEAVWHKQRRKAPVVPAEVKGGLRDGLMAVVRHPFAVIRSGLVGTILGTIPGIGISTSNIVAYVVESKLSKEGGFGEGNVVGVMAAEAADDGTMPAELIPTFTLGIPGAAASALMLEAITIHGLQPGLSFFNGNPITAGFFVAMFLSQISFALFGIGLSKYLAKASQIPGAIMAPIIIVLGAVGAYAVGGRMGDVAIALIFGLVGYVIIKLHYPLAPMVLGAILGPLAESNYRRAALIASATHVSPFLHPVPIILAVISIGAFMLPFINRRPKPGAVERA